MATTDECDSIVTYQIELAGGEEVGSQTRTTCRNEPQQIGGVLVQPGDSTQIRLLSSEGCDSLVNVLLLYVPATVRDTVLFTCDSTTSAVFEDSISVDVGETLQKVSVNAGGCDELLSITARVSPTVSILPNDTTMCSDRLILKSLVGPVVWQGAANTTSTITISNSGTYTATYTAPTGCTYSESISVALAPDRVYVPSAFSPNSDGTNDCFSPSFALGTEFRAFTLRIYDRWGGLLFSSNDPQVCWEGEGKSTAVDTNVYLYVIDYERTGCPDQVQLSGLVHLVR